MNITREVPKHLQAEYDRIIRELKHTRQRKEISQADIAEKCGISFTTVSAIERGIQNCSTTTLIGYLGALHLTYSDLEKPQDEAVAFPTPKISPAVQDRLETLSYEQQEQLMAIPAGTLELLERIPQAQQMKLAEISPKLLEKISKLTDTQQEKLITLIDICFD